jgi:hypothetical protein
VQPRRGGAGTKPATETEAGVRVSRGCACVRGHVSWCRGTGGGDLGGASPASSGGEYGRRWPESRRRRAHRTELVSCACFFSFFDVSRVPVEREGIERGVMSAWGPSAVRAGRQTPHKPGIATGLHVVNNCFCQYLYLICSPSDGCLFACAKLFSDRNRTNLLVRFSCQ